ncbi:Phospholipase C 2 precursor [Mycobacterium basiliense]|uniref:Phospholipase C 2 n=1 Tax=Mycobacterium basiliense TaxID=2094119 RepID=A0A3S4FNY5_9MYCO|nr:Phospholipase C 2 precursor [Mycobacterium basiliense]
MSWVLPGFLLSEHPAFPANVGAVAIVDVLRILLSNPAVWEKTALIVSYDEIGGFSTMSCRPHHHRGRITVADISSVDGSGGIRGPIGLGFRVPSIVISPNSRGPLMVHDTFDHTSQLKQDSQRTLLNSSGQAAVKRRVLGQSSGAGKTTPGLRMPAGSKDCLMRRMRPILTGSSRSTK